MTRKRGRGARAGTGTVVPRPFSDGWRMFWTQQHGDNTTYEVEPAS